MSPNFCSRFTFSVLLLNLFVATPVAHASADTGQLIVKFQGFDNNNGKLGASIVNNPRHFLGNYRKSVRYSRTQIQGREATWVIDNLPFGNYAISSYHDENNNKKYDRNGLGIPVEDYGFSNNVRVRFSVPEYEDALFTFSRNGQVVVIEMENFAFSTANLR